jgi:hypothetical protein
VLEQQEGVREAAGAPFLDERLLERQAVGVGDGAQSANREFAHA